MRKKEVTPMSDRQEDENGNTGVTPRPDFRLWEELNALPPADLEDGPVVDRNSLVSLYRGELSPPRERTVYGRVVRYRRWREAYADVLSQIARAEHN